MLKAKLSKKNPPNTSAGTMLLRLNNKLTNVLSFDMKLNSGTVKRLSLRSLFC